MLLLKISSIESKKARRLCFGLITGLDTDWWPLNSPIYLGVPRMPKLELNAIWTVWMPELHWVHCFEEPLDWKDA